MLTPYKPEPSAEAPYFPLNINREKYLRLASHQLFVRNFANPSTPYSRLLIKHDMGTGKTMTSLSVAMEYIRYYKDSNLPIGSIYIIGWTRAAFERELFGHPEFGFISRDEREYMLKLTKLASAGGEANMKKYVEFMSMLSRRLGDRKNGGFFQFIGYGELANRVFLNNGDIMKLSEAELEKAMRENKLDVNSDFIDQFKNSLMIVDEFHNTYNALEKNNYGIALQTILNAHGPAVRALFLSGTILKNSQTEIIDVLNLIAGSAERRFHKSDFFGQDDHVLLPGSIEKISDIARGRVSFLVEINPALYPSAEYMGHTLEATQYFRFWRCPMPPDQRATYDSIKDNIRELHEHPYVFDMVFPNPNGPLGLYRSQDLRTVEKAPKEWRTQNQISIHDGEVSGGILALENLKKWSAKYSSLIELIHSDMPGGKMFIFHKNTHMTGVFLLMNILARNGVIGVNSQPDKHTLCVRCGKLNHPDDLGHVFTPARFICLHGGLKKTEVKMLLGRFNSIENTDGSKIWAVIGSLVMKESTTLMAVRKVCVMSRPDNIPSLNQITARAVRAGSHVHLPPELRTVSIYLFVASYATDSAESTYEEKKYSSKVLDYKIIQQIEKVLHSNAIDAVVNRAVIEPALVENKVGHLMFEPNIHVAEALRPADLNLTTFNIYHRQYEINELIYVIKRLFVGTSPVWKFDDLWVAARAPPFALEYNPSMFDISSFIVALESILWNENYVDTETTVSPVDLLLDPDDKRLFMNGVVCVVVLVGEFYMVAPIVNDTIHIDTPYRSFTSHNIVKINVNKYTKTMLNEIRYGEYLDMFKKEYEGKSLSDMTDAICKYGQLFHIKLAESVIEYAFSMWTDKTRIASKEYNAFYFQMLYYYDAVGLIIWLNSAKAYIRDMYAEHSIPQTPDTSSILPKEFAERSRGELMYIVRSIQRAGCSWCPSLTKSRYDAALAKSQKRFVAMASADMNVGDDMVPIGHTIDEYTKFYSSTRGWFLSPEYTQSTGGEWSENSVIIGYDMRTASGLNFQFKLRPPKQRIKKHTDSRLIEKGVMCVSHHKPRLAEIAKSVGVNSLGSGMGIHEICREIRARLMYLELIERAKGSRVKYYYNQFEHGDRVV